MNEAARTGLKHRLAGFVTVNIPEGPGHYRFVGQLLKLVALMLLLGFFLFSFAMTFGFAAVLFFALVGWLILDVMTGWMADLGFPPWEWSTLAPLAYPILTVLTAGLVATLVMNHVVLWWARRETKGLWAGRIAGLFAMTFSVGGLWDALGNLEAGFGGLSLLWLGLFVAGAAILALSFRPATRAAFDAGSDRRSQPEADPETEAVFEPVGETS